MQMPLSQKAGSVYFGGQDVIIACLDALSHGPQVHALKSNSAGRGRGVGLYYLKPCLDWRAQIPDHARMNLRVKVLKYPEPQLRFRMHKYHVPSMCLLLDPYLPSTTKTIICVGSLYNFYVGLDNKTLHKIVAMVVKDTLRLIIAQRPSVYVYIYIYLYIYI